MIAPVVLFVLHTSAVNLQRPCLCFAPAMSPQAATPAAAVVSGVIRDSEGGVVSGASVVIRVGTGLSRQTTSGPDGQFSLPVAAAAEVTITVRAPGFKEYKQTLASGAARADLAVVLVPAAVAETVTVTATGTEQRMGDVPSTVTVVSSEQIRQSPAAAADDVLRQVPTFSLFRRTSSLASNPTAQGVSLRGIGPSGVSRTLVLLDGVPFNDPFGGWVYWSRVPLESAERIEVVEGANSSLYGNYAMGGVINILTTPAARRSLDMRTSYGTLSSPKVDVVASDVWGKVGVVVDGTAFDTKGYAIVAPSERGLVDNKAAVSFRNLNVRLNYDASDRLHAFVRAGRFREERDNGKASTIDGTEEANDTTWTSASGGFRYQLRDRSEIQAVVFGDSERFHSNFLAVPAATPARSIGRMTLLQTVPTSAVGASVQWSRAFAKQVLTAGTDVRWIDGDSREDGLDGTLGTSVILKRVSGGTQRISGAFVQDLISPTDRLLITLGVRVDRWRNYDAHNLETNFPSGTPTANDNANLPGRQDTVASPRVGVAYRFSDRVRAFGNLASGFRAPTLNELYRQFRVGTRLTLANNQLGPERLRGGELGVSVAPVDGLTWRTTWFDNRVKNPVSNVTLSTVGANVTLQRQNLGRTKIWGVQTDVEYRMGPWWRVAAGYVYNQAKVVAFDANPLLVGKFLPQVPQHRGSVQVAYTNPRWLTFSVSVQGVGAQFDDDQNTVVVPGYSKPGLPKYAVVDFNLSRAIGRNVEVFAGAQNLFDQQYFVGTLPTTIGSPRLVTGGLRVRIRGR